MIRPMHGVAAALLIHYRKEITIPLGPLTCNCSRLSKQCHLFYYLRTRMRWFMMEDMYKKRDHSAKKY